MKQRNFSNRACDFVRKKKKDLVNEFVKKAIMREK